jgi:hypothetical protein
MMMVAHDREASDDIVREMLVRNGPPFLFAAYQQIEVGERFVLVGNSFVVTRMIEASEFEHNAGRYPLQCENAQCFFEAVTD